ncbi:FAD-dependent oxidoreductase [Acinetobacter sp. S40]|uniref:FAD-dependent oxidoreductase n=1 Tax=Acinetobacter sp. S40 TaxID=2767434 RepID=UPI00190C93AB|nr:FAD-dependent oxidoreductase [Acinetobacter sp. S40]MBJ9984911.1 FAD-dependent oxidoreductase [Acinetobacter sp. S40]
MNTPLPEQLECDLIVVGAGAGGLSTAITARKKGLNVIVLEKDQVFGGTTAFSGGVLWIPGNHHAKQNGIQDSREAALEYLKHETKQFFNADAVNAFLDYAPEMLKFFEQETTVKFIPTLYPDYHPDAPGGVDIGRSVLAAPYDIRGLGEHMQRLRPPLKTITFIGMMFNSSNADLKHFFNATKSFTSFMYVAKRLAIHLKELARYGRGTNVTSGNALAARLAKSALELDIPIYTDAAVQALISENGKVTGLKVKSQQQSSKIKSRYGVVLACGGFSHDIARLKQAYPHLRRGGEHISPVPKTNTGDGCRLAESVGGIVDIQYKDTSAWMPVSKVPYSDGFGVFPHLLDRYKPGIIGVLKNGKRFTNESNSYHDVGADLVRACEEFNETAMWLICDQKTISKYGLGYAKPAPMPLAPLIKKGYLIKGNRLEDLAQQAGIDAKTLVKTVERYNVDAVKGEDPEFHRGSTSFNRYLADAEHKPNPCVAPITQGPFYAVKVFMGDLGTFDGIRTAVTGEVLDQFNQKIAGLYAVGNDRASIMGGNYPGAGITLGPIMTFGYITGSHIADLAKGGQGLRCFQKSHTLNEQSDQEIRHVS